EPPESTLREAANLAAYYSQSRASAGVPVDYTPRKFVKKPSGARPGMVIYSTNRTLYVTPDTQLVQRLRENAAQK
ncbi:MAG: fibronectin/fibrinogen-binding protein, partial [Eubacteriales bacterium]